MRGGLLLVVVCAGCAAPTLPSYIHADPSELRACAAAPTGCSVWTDGELNGVMTEIMNKAILYGRQIERGAL